MRSLCGLWGLIRRGRFSYFHSYVLLGLNLILVAALIEMLWEQWLISEVFVRRAMIIPPFIQGVYVDYILNTFSDLETWLFGQKLDVGIAIYIGQDYLGFENLNANTNAFMYALASGGLVLYLSAILFVSFVLVSLMLLINLGETPFYGDWRYVWATLDRAGVWYSFLIIGNFSLLASGVRFSGGENKG